jgi:crotonobetainyl-CoA:carnitine CoA-transferase CaiB-like acyl-CoA transferase
MRAAPSILDIMQNEQTLLGIYRVLDLADEKGVYCGKLLADYGADVIKIEPPQGDIIRARGPFLHDEVHPEKSLYWLHFNTDKRSITLNLEHEQGRNILKRLIKTADVLIETFPPGYMKSLGLDYEALKEINPGLVMCSIAPFGQSGPHRDWKSSDLVNSAISGMMHFIGEPDGPPVPYGAEQSYHSASLYAFTGILFALYHRDLTSGSGQYIDMSLQEAYASLFNAGVGGVVQAWVLVGEEGVRSGNRPGRAFPYGGFPAKDGWALICCVDPGQWDALAQWIAEETGDEEILDDMYKGRMWDRGPYLDILTRIVDDFTSRFTMEELMVNGQKRGVPIYAVTTAKELMDCPQLAHFNFFSEVDHPLVGRLKYPGVPALTHDVPGRIRTPAPLLGQDNEEIYCGELGYSKEQLGLLRSDGVI